MAGRSRCAHIVQDRPFNSVPSKEIKYREKNEFTVCKINSRKKPAQSSQKRTAITTTVNSHTFGAPDRVELASCESDLVRRGQPGEAKNRSFQAATFEHDICIEIRAIFQCLIFYAELINFALLSGAKRHFARGVPRL